jgi:hypothetical protein
VTEHRFADELPDGVDPARLVITFRVDGEELMVGPHSKAWVDMQTAPANGDIVSGRALGLETPRLTRVSMRLWHAHNWLEIWLDSWTGS